MKKLVVIPARGGSKGLPKKNIKILADKPLIQYSIDTARSLVADDDICISTDSDEIIAVVEKGGLKVPFVRPAEFATDTASSRDVIVHALNYYASKGRKFEMVILLQPTSPFRKNSHLKAMVDLFSPDLDMVVSVKEPHNNPYFSMFEENAGGFLELSKKGTFQRRQDCPKVYAYNGSIYVINSNSILSKNFNEFTRIRKFVMDDTLSIDIDTQFDWWMAELMLEKELWKA